MSERKAISKKLRFEVFKRDNFTCQYCGRMAPDVILEIDHINPVKNKGTNDILNLITSCKDCNRGKGARKLSESDILKKQQEQLKEINEKREQLKLLVKWKEELEKFSDEEVDEIEQLLKQATGDIFSEFGRNNCKKIIKKYGFKEVYECAEISIKQYYDCNDEDSISKVFSMIPRICNNRAKQKENPDLYKINYLCKIGENRLCYFNSATMKQYLMKNFKSDDFEYLKDIFCTAKNWTNLKMFLRDYYLEEI